MNSFDLGPQLICGIQRLVIKKRGNLVELLGESELSEGGLKTARCYCFFLVLSVHRGSCGLSKVLRFCRVIGVSQSPRGRTS